jgi:hypothetical protein
MSKIDNENEAIILSSMTELTTPIHIKLIGDIIYSIKENFHALYYKVKIMDDEFKVPIWWPNNPHISFIYRYNEPFTQKEIDELKNKIQVKDGVITEIKLMRCIGHYLTWAQINN